MTTQSALNEGVVLNSALFDYDEERKRFVSHHRHFLGMTNGLYQRLYPGVSVFGFALNTPCGIVPFVPSKNVVQDGEVIGCEFAAESPELGYTVEIVHA